jgi:hypothetical protein
LNKGIPEIRALNRMWYSDSIFGIVADLNFG